MLRFLTGLVSLLLAACGGGGGGSGDDGAFTLSETAVEFRAAPGAPLPIDYSVAMRVTGKDVRYVGAAFLKVPDPGWLHVYMEGYDPEFEVRVAPNTTSLPEGTYTTIVTAGTADKDGKVLETRDIEVTYTIDTPVRIGSWSDTLPQFVHGHSNATTTFTLDVAAGTDDVYGASSDAAWVTPPTGTFQGPQQDLPFAVDVTGLGVGTHTAKVTVQNADKAWDKDTRTVTVSVVAPQVTAPDSVLIGGSSGLEVTPSAMQFSIGTGTRAHPWTATLTTTSGGAWLSSDLAGGTVSATAQPLALDAARSPLAPGVYAGNLRIDVDVDGLVVTKNVPVTLNRAAEKVLVTADGVALTQLPSRARLTRDVRVLSTLDRADVPWTATDDQDWLEITPSGLTGGTLTLTANPLLLAADMLHEATVTIVSGDPTVTNTETIRVGLWIGSADAAAVNVPGYVMEAVMDPVAPWVYTLVANSDTVLAYNVYTGALVKSIPTGVTTAARGVAVSSDGRTLFVHEFPNRATTGESQAKAYALRVSDGERLATYDFSVFDYAYELSYGRPDARPMLYAHAGSRAIDVATGATFFMGLGAFEQMSSTADQRTVFTHGGNVFIGRTTLRHSTLGGDALHYKTGSYVLMGSGDGAVSPDGSRLYGTGILFGGDPTAFKVYNPLTETQLDPIPAIASPNNVEVSWNGVLAGGVRTSQQTTNLWFYDAGGALLGSDSCSGVLGHVVLRDTVRFSGDGLRYLCSAERSDTDASRYTWIRDVPAQ